MIILHVRLISWWFSRLIDLLFEIPKIHVPQNSWCYPQMSGFVKKTKDIQFTDIKE